MKSPSCFILLMLILCFEVSHAEELIKVELECNVAGTKLTGEKSSKLFIEKILIDRKENQTLNKNGKNETWAISKVELESAGMKIEPSLIKATPEYAVIAYSNAIGSGYSRKLLAFTYILDLKALELTRIVNTLPAGEDERTQNICTQK